MCGICGYIDISGETGTDLSVLQRMTDTLYHRGPDSSGYLVQENLALGFRRLSIVDLEHGNQPLYNEDGSLALICNGEIFNYRELRKELEPKGHEFRTNCDVEVLLHLYEEEGVGFLNRLNGQFAFALYDQNRRRLFLARDHFGVCPLYYTITNGLFVFGSEIKALLAHPGVPRAVDLTGLDQILTFPGLISPRTMFRGVESLKSGHYMLVEGGDVQIREYWDLTYPPLDEADDDARSEESYVEELEELLARSVRYRLQADVPVGFYLSGGLDSSIIAALINHLTPGARRNSFSITFSDESICEERYQKLVAAQVSSLHHEIPFDWDEIAGRLRRVVYHSETPLKETYNTASLALSEAAKSKGIPVVLTGEGADELFAGYLGYRFDQVRRAAHTDADYSLETVLEDELRQKLWGDKKFFYETDYYALREMKRVLYSSALNDAFPAFDCFNFGLIDKEKIRGRHYIHQRSYVDFKLRIADHLLTDHGDKMALANSVEARYPFLDINLVSFVERLPPALKLNGFTEKYILKRVAEHLIPLPVVNREKFAFVAPGSPYLLKQKIEWIEDLLSSERLKREGFFNPETVERLKRQYVKADFDINTSFERDFLIIVLTFGIFLELFNLS